jgi:hypothetical protein
MKNIRLDSLDDYDIDAFMNKVTVARIFTTRAGWYIGICKRIKIEGPFCIIGLHPFARFTHHGSQDPHDPREPLLAEYNLFIEGSYEENGQPFRLRHTQKIVYDTPDNEILGIVFSGGVSLFSRRTPDIIIVKRFLEIAAI